MSFTLKSNSESVGNGRRHYICSRCITHVCQVGGPIFFGQQEGRKVPPSQSGNYAWIYMISQRSVSSRLQPDAWIRAVFPTIHTPADRTPIQPPLREALCRTLYNLKNRFTNPCSSFWDTVSQMLLFKPTWHHFCCLFNLLLNCSLKISIQYLMW